MFIFPDPENTSKVLKTRGFVCFICLFSGEFYKFLPSQITTIGRYGGSTTRSRIPIGCFYGHTTLLPWEVDAYNKELGASLGTEKAGVLSQLGTLVRLQQCAVSCIFQLESKR